MGIRGKFPGSDLTLSANTHREHTRPIAMEKPVRRQWRSWETFEGITREKGRRVRLSSSRYGAHLFPLSSPPFSPSFPTSAIALGCLVSLLYGRMATENTRRKGTGRGWAVNGGGQRAQTERISPLVRDLQNFSFLSARALVASPRFAVQSIGYENSRNMREYRLPTIAVLAGVPCGNARDTHYIPILQRVDLNANPMYFTV